MDIRQVIQELVVPELQEIKGDVKVLHSEMRRLDQRIDSVDQHLERMEHRFESLEHRFDSTIDLHERIARLEATRGHN